MLEPWSSTIKLVEGGLGELCDEVWLVTCDPMVQRERLVGRGEAAEDAEIRVQMQGDLVDRLRPRATRVVDTSEDPAVTRLVDELFDEGTSRRLARARACSLAERSATSLRGGPRESAQAAPCAPGSCALVRIVR